MRKFILSISVTAIFVAYIFFQHYVPAGVVIAPPGVSVNNLPATGSIASTDTAAAGTGPLPDTGSTPAATTPTAPVKTTASTAAPAPVKKPSGQYSDGTYVGKSIDAYYGYVQVEAIVSNGKLANVQFLSYPNDRATSRQINGQAMPYLRAEAIQAQSSNVDIVTGATDTSEAFQQSLASALSQAKS